MLIGLGSNIRPRENLRRAVELLTERLEVTAVSRFYESPAKGAPGTPPFLNAAVVAETDLTPEALKFDVLRPIEARMGRIRGDDPNEPRVVDLDLTLYGDLVVDGSEPNWESDDGESDDGGSDLVLPDPELLASAHVILPAAEVAGEWRHPVDGRSLAELAEAFLDDPEIRIDEAGGPPTG